MLNKLGHKMAAIANMAKLAAKTPHGSRWEKLLSTLASVQAWSEKVDLQDNRLVEVSGFGSNPGELKMYTYLPEGLPADAPLVVVLHGCTQSAASYNKGSGWSTVADRHGFALLFPQQQWNNNPLRCFNWFRPEDNERERGEPLSIKQMVEKMAADHAIDRRRVYVTGTSSGGAMTAVMLASYPDVFAGGAVIAGVPYRTAKGLQEGLESIFQGRSRSGSEWGELVRAASSHQGPWPRLSVWHGDADTAVKPVNAEEIIKQWADVHGLDTKPTIEMRVDGYPRRVWQGADGEELIESYTITGMSHGAALDPGPEPHQCGTAAPFFNAVGISFTHRIADFWGLLGEPPASAKSAGAAAAAGAARGKASADEAAARSRKTAAAGAAAAASGGARPADVGEPPLRKEPTADSGKARAETPEDAAPRVAGQWGQRVSTCMASFRPRCRRLDCSSPAAARDAARRLWGSTFPASFRPRWKRLACSRAARSGRRRSARKPCAALAGKVLAGSCCTTTRAHFAAAQCSMGTPLQETPVPSGRGRNRFRGSLHLVRDRS